MRTVPFSPQHAVGLGSPVLEGPGDPGELDWP